MDYGDLVSILGQKCFNIYIYKLYINFNDNGRPGDPYVKSTDKYIYKYTLAKVKVYVFS